MNDGFQAPSSIEDAERRILDLNQSIREIMVQLSDKNREDGNGNRVTGHEYHTWRQRAITAKAYKESELAFVKQWIREQNRKMQELLACERFNFEVDNPVSLLAAVYKLLRDLKEAGAQMTKEEMALMDVVRDYLRGAL